MSTVLHGDLYLRKYFLLVPLDICVLVNGRFGSLFYEKQDGLALSLHKPEFMAKVYGHYGGCAIAPIQDEENSCVGRPHLLLYQIRRDFLAVEAAAKWDNSSKRPQDVGSLTLP